MLLIKTLFDVPLLMMLLLPHPHPHLHYYFYYYPQHDVHRPHHRLVLLSTSPPLLLLKRRRSLLHSLLPLKIMKSPQDLLRTPLLHSKVAQEAAY